MVPQYLGWCKFEGIKPCLALGFAKMPLSLSLPTSSGAMDQSEWPGTNLCLWTLCSLLSEAYLPIC